MADKNTLVTMSNILVEEIDRSNLKTSGGICIPTEAIDSGKKNILSVGKVVNKGPGFILPYPPKEGELDNILHDKPQPIILHMDIEIGDIIHFTKGMSEATLLNNKWLIVVPYQAVKLIEREMGT